MTKKPDSSKEDLRGNLSKLASRKDALKIQKLWYVLEHWEDTSNPHIHIFMETTKSLKKQKLATYEKAGTINIQKAKGTLAEIEDYMTKENPIEKII